MRRFEGKTAVVTGAASGIGRAAAIRLASEGARVACLDVEEAGAKQTVATIERAGGSARHYVCDVSDPDVVRAVSQAVLADLGDPYVVCNIAGVVSASPLEELAFADWQRVIDINLTGTFLMCQAYMPALKRTGGNIVNTGSRLGVNGRPYRAAYCASKAGVHLLTKALALEFAEQGVRVNAILPGATRTGLMNAPPPPSPRDLSAGAARSPLGMGEPEDVAAAIAFIASDEMHYMTGSVVAVDGGVTA
ncbi:MAG TPA: SDR family NAD(P)-dependent oxidoreductase [Frankiaceae bacterium]|jgi:NAD(P)-dependent dehydrogenase (short-subunit alcohol dehydrogenase family)|nr:SDR family NAD(P)-dependent oxidoreductase [Frankiaceae bacterium]